MNLDFGAQPLPAGLPARFTSGKDGLRRLQELLGVPNRRELQSLLHVPVIRKFLKPLKSKFRGLKTARRLEQEIIAFYSDPEQRRIAWEFSFETNAIGGMPIVPSLEFEAMKQYNPKFLGLDVPHETIDESLAAFGDYFDWEYSTHFEIPMFHVWPDLRQDLTQWGTLSSDRQEVVGLATFAMATLLDDSRFLTWAASHSKILATDFAFAFEDLARGGRTPHTKAEKHHADSTAYRNILRDWNRNCELIIDIAGRLKSDPPQPERFDDLFRPIDKLKKLRNPLELALTQRDRVRLIESLSETISSCSEDFNASWLGVVSAPLVAQWKLEYLYESETTEKAIRRDVERFRLELTTEVRNWRRWEDAKENRRRELEAFEFRTTKDLFSQLDDEDREAGLHETMAEAARQANEAKRRILRVLAPSGKVFNSTRDYERELAEAERKADQSSVSLAAGSSEPLQESDAAASPRKEAKVRGSSRAATTKHSVADTNTADVGDEEPRGQAASDDPWHAWLRDVGDPALSRRIELPSLNANPRLSSGFSFSDPQQFAHSLTEKILNNRLASRRESLENLTTFLYSDPNKGRPEWYEVYHSILGCVINHRSHQTSYRSIAFLLIELMLRTYRTVEEYRSLVDASRKFSDDCIHDGEVQLPVELAELFLGPRCSDMPYLAEKFLNTINEVISSNTLDHLPSRLQKITDEVETIVRDSSQESRKKKLSKYLSGKKMIVYTLQTTTAKTLKRRLESIEPSVKIRLLENSVWNDSLVNPVRNADICLMVKSASKHNMIDMISRTRNDVGKDVLEPASKGLESAMREVYRAAGLNDVL